MNIDRKKEMIQLAHSISSDINKQGCGNYTSKIINAIEIAEKREDINVFFQVLNKMKFTTFGGNAQKDGFIGFVDEIIKNSKYKINSLNFEELKFVFQWVNRVVKTKSDNRSESKTGRRNNFNRRENNSYEKNNGYIKNNGRNNSGKGRAKVYEDKSDNIEDNPFAKLLGKF